MSLAIPAGVCPAITTEPLTMVEYAYPGVGKSPSIAILPDNYYIDLQLGTKYHPCRRVPVSNVQEYIEAATYWREHRTSFVTVDPITVLYEWAVGLATEEYRRKPVGRNFDTSGAETVLDLVAQDATGRAFAPGYRFVRETFMRLIRMVYPTRDNRLITVGHVRDALMADIGQGEKGGKTSSEFDTKDLDIDGKLRNIFLSEMDLAIYAFRSATSVLKLTTAVRRNNAFAKCRCPSLLNKTFDFHTPTTVDDWRQIYPETIARLCDTKPEPTP